MGDNQGQNKNKIAVCTEYINETNSEYNFDTFKHTIYVRTEWVIIEVWYGYKGRQQASREGGRRLSEDYHDTYKVIEG